MFFLLDWIAYAIWGKDRVKRAERRLSKRRR